MLRFPKLHEKIVDVVTNLLRRRLPPTNTMVSIKLKIRHKCQGGCITFYQADIKILNLEVSRRSSPRIKSHSPTNKMVNMKIEIIYKCQGDFSSIYLNFKV